jgi:hypothetical protein
MLLPSMTIGRGLDCVMGERGEMMTSGHGAHALSHAVSHQADDNAPAGLPHPPAQCVSLAACGVAAVIAPTTQFDNPSHGADRVASDARLAPDSPTFGVEPPPPRT